MVNAVTYILGNDAGVQALVGAKSQEDVDQYYKVYPVVVPSTEVAPYVVVRQAGKVPQGKNCDHEYTIEVSSYANSYDEAAALNAAVIAAIIEQANATINGEAFGYLNLANEVDGYEREHNLFVKTTTFEGMAE